MDSDENEPTSSTNVPDESNSSTTQKTFKAKNQFNEASVEGSTFNMNDGDAHNTSGTGTVIHKANIISMISATDGQPSQQVGESLGIRIWNFAINASGRTAMILATGAAVTLFTAVTQSISIIHELCQAFAPHSNQALTSFASGSITVQVLTKGDEAMKILLQDCFSGKITREVKKIVEEALKKKDAECEIESVTLTEVGVVMADQELFDDIKTESEQTLSQPSTSQDLFKNEVTLSTTSSILLDKYQVMTQKISPTATEEDVINEIRNLELRLQTQTMAIASPESISKSQSTSEKHPASGTNTSSLTSGTTSSKFTLNDVFTMDDKPLAAKKQEYLNALGPELKDAQDQLDNYKLSMESGRLQESTLIRDHLTALIRDKIRATPQEIKQFGIEFRNKSKYFESILFFDVASVLSGERLNADDAVVVMQSCVYGMKESIEAILEADSSRKSLIGHHIIPVMMQIKQKIHNIDATREVRCHNEAWCLHRIEWVHHLVGNYYAREALLKEGIDLMRNCFGEDAEEYSIFGHLLNNLGSTYENLSRNEEASDFYTKAIQAYKKAKNHPSENEKDERIKLSEINLKITKDKMSK